jgi:hypothetical protein
VVLAAYTTKVCVFEGEGLLKGAGGQQVCAPQFARDSGAASVHWSSK